MKKIFCTTCLALSTLFSYSQVHRAVDLSSSWKNGDLEYSAINNDYCDYYVGVNLDKLVGYQPMPSPHTATIGKGSTYLFTLKKELNTLASTNITYFYYRGNVDKKPNVNFQYALPIKLRDSTRIKPLNNNNYTLRFNLQETSDTIYACRGGIVCDDDIYDISSKGYKKKKNQITISHNDGTFAEYALFTTPLVFAGENVKMGAPIAIAPQGAKLEKEIQVGIYFLDKNKVKVITTGSKHTHFIPIFHTANAGDTKLKEKNTYIAEITKEVLMQDMSSKEKKKYLKEKEKNNEKK